jgi:hypothetical protein
MQTKSLSQNRTLVSGRTLRKRADRRKRQAELSIKLPLF